MTRRALICSNHFDTWSGSELVAIEISEGLQERGWLVDTFVSSGDLLFIKDAFPDNERIFNEASELPDIEVYDLIYTQHQACVPYLGLQYNRDSFSRSLPAFIYAHLSPFSPYEKPFSLTEGFLADLILVNSQETFEVVSEYGPAYEEISIFPNPVPKSFRQKTCRNRNIDEQKRNILVVSNHIPKEVRSAIEILRQSNVDVSVIGLSDTSTRVCAETIDSADAVVTIGKTVQYALARACPVFCYDHFGGPGWLTDANFDLAEKYNFSGRCAGTKHDGETLAGMLIKTPPESERFSENFEMNFPKRLLLSFWLDIFEDLSPRPNKIRGEDFEFAIKRDLIISEILRNTKSRISEYTRAYKNSSKNNKKLREKIEKIEEQLGAAQRENEALKQDAVTGNRG